MNQFNELSSASFLLLAEEVDFFWTVSGQAVRVFFTLHLGVYVCLQFGLSYGECSLAIMVGMDGPQVIIKLIPGSSRVSSCRNMFCLLYQNPTIFKPIRPVYTASLFPLPPSPHHPLNVSLSGLLQLKAAEYIYTWRFTPIDAWTVCVAY